MTRSDWVHAVVACCRDGQFWCETFRDAFCLITEPSNGLSIALAGAVLGTGHRVLCTACKMVSTRTSGNIDELTGITSQLMKTHDRQLFSH